MNKQNIEPGDLVACLDNGNQYTAIWKSGWDFDGSEVLIMKASRFERVLKGEAVESDDEWQDRRERERDEAQRMALLNEFALSSQQALRSMYGVENISSTTLAEWAFDDAEAMLAESERRRWK